MTRYADLSGELNEILKEIWKITSWRVLLSNIFLIFCRGGLRGDFMSEYSHTLMIIQEINSLCEKYKKRIYLIIVLIYNLDGGNKWDINTYEYITNDKGFFYIGGSILIIFNGNFLYFYFCKGWDACRFFYITKGTLIFAFAWHLGSAWAWQYLGVHKLCKRCL